METVSRSGLSRGFALLCLTGTLPWAGTLAGCSSGPGAAAGPGTANQGSGSSAVGGVALRVLTYNVHEFGPVTPTPKSKSALATARGSRSAVKLVADALRPLRADVIALQEAGSGAQVQDLAIALQMRFVHFPGGWVDPEGGRPEGIPTAILTRHEIVSSANCPMVNYETRPSGLFTRGFGSAVISIGSEEIAFFVAHLLPSWPNTTHIREGEIREITAAAQKEVARGRSVVVLGDMNHKPSAPEYALWNKGGFVDAAATKGTGPQLTSPSNQPVERIDYVFAAGPLADRLSSVRALRDGTWAVDPSNPASYAISDHLPVVAEFRARVP